jgi:hypothetical protein
MTSEHAGRAPSSTSCFKLLGNDAGLIAETLARTDARRTIDPELVRKRHPVPRGSERRGPKRRARRATARPASKRCLGDYRETTWTRSDGRSARPMGPKDGTVALDDDEWDSRLKRLEKTLP